MSRILKIGTHRIDAEAIVAINCYDFQCREYIDNKGLRPFPLCLLDIGKPDIYEGKEVYRSPIAGRYVHGAIRKKMRLIFSNKEDICADLDEAIIAQWEAWKNR